jgi:hypothetical protein
MASFSIKKAGLGVSRDRLFLCAGKRADDIKAVIVLIERIKRVIYLGHVCRT